MAKKRFNQKIRGSGGSSDNTPHIPVESPNSLSSHAFLHLLDLVCEGEIQGLTNGAKSIFLNDTPLQNTDGTFNFPGVSYATRNGTQNQSYISQLPQVENEIAVSVEVKYGIPIVRTITSDTVDRIRARIQFPQLTQTDVSSGDVGGSTVTFHIDLQPSGGSYSTVYTKTIYGKSASAYELDVNIPLTGSGPWNLRVTRDTADSVSAYIQNKTIWESYTEIVDAKLRYPNSALIALSLDAQYFSSVPTRSYDLKLLKIKVPSNYNPTTRAYTGSWDGTFQTLWSDNPAWVFYDLATAERYGLGRFIPEDQVDKWALYEIAKYCDELVPDGFGGTEPRFTCNMMLGGRGDAYTVMQSLASTFRGMIYWSAGSVTVSQDSPTDAVNIFTQANVVDGKFTYQGASSKVRHTVALVTWNDPANSYKSVVEYVEDQDGITRYGVQQTQLVAFGCTSRGQAHRLGKWLLYTEQYESDAVTFSTGLEAIVGRPGNIIKIADPSRAGARMAGRISSATTTLVTVDADITGSITGFSLSVLLPTGAIEERPVVGSTSSRTIQVSTPFSVAPQTQAIWALKSPAIEPQTFRVIGIKESGEGIFEISAIRHDPDKFAFIENGVQLEPKSYSNLTAVPSAPTNLVITESLYQSAVEVRTKITVSWDRVDRAASYLGRYQKDSNNWVDLPETSFNDLEILDVQPGIFTIQISAVNSVGKPSAAVSATKEIYGKTALPSNVSGFSVIPNAGTAFLSWVQSPDLDVLVGGQVRIRHTPLTTGQGWRDAVDIIPAIPGASTTATAPLLDGTYMAKFVDSSGNYSQTEALIITTAPSAQALNIVSVQEEDPGFTGVRTNMAIDTATNALVLSSLEPFDLSPLIDTVFNFDFPGAISQLGTYDFKNTVDLGGVWPTNLTSQINLAAFDIGNLFDARLDDIDNWQDIDGSFIDDVNAILYVRSTTDNPSASPTWTEWKPFRTAQLESRGFQFRLVCTSGTPTHNLYIKALGVTLHLDERTLQLGPFTSGTGASFRVNYAQPFFAIPVVGVTEFNAVSGDYKTITSADKTGFNIVFKDASNNIVSRNFSSITKGYGRQTA